MVTTTSLQRKKYIKKAIKNKKSDGNQDFMYYPGIEDEDFYRKIYLKKEFNKNKIPRETRAMDEICPLNKKKSFKLLPQQEFLRNYISIDTPYNGVLIVHGTGVGKTCSAISIAEGFKETLKHSEKKVLVIVGRSIREQFKNEIYSFTREINKQRSDDIVQCSGVAYELGREAKYLTKEQRKKKIRNLINQVYEFVGYEKFANDVMKKTNWSGDAEDITKNIRGKISKDYSNRVIIIDEIQNIKTSDLLRRKVQQILQAIVTYGKNIRLVLMSATPMFDRPHEIVYLLNLLLLNDGRQPLDQQSIFRKDGSLKSGGQEIISNSSKGYISYLRGGKPSFVPS